MAKCRRCGTNYDYEKREGVCPKCCFYNRPSSSPVPDDQWMKNYDIEDNTYEPPRLSAEEISTGQKRKTKGNRNRQDKKVRSGKDKKMRSGKKKSVLDPVPPVDDRSGFFPCFSGYVQ